MGRIIKRGLEKLNNHPNKSIHVLPFKHSSCHFPPNHLLFWPTFAAFKKKFKYASLHSHITHSLFTILRLSFLPSSSCSLPTLLLILFLSEFHRTTHQPYIIFHLLIIFSCRLNNTKFLPFSFIYK